MVAYCWTAVEGYSAFGSYSGNGKADGPFVQTGFAPRYVLIKRTDTSGYGWYVYDSERDATNPAVRELRLESTNGENIDSGDAIDLLFDGFKVRTTYPGHNVSGGTYVYAAFADLPVAF